MEFDIACELRRQQHETSQKEGLAKLIAYEAAQMLMPSGTEET